MRRQQILAWGLFSTLLALASAGCGQPAASPAAPTAPAITLTTAPATVTAIPKPPLPTRVPTFTTGPTATPAPTSTPLPTATPAARLAQVIAAEHYFDPADLLVRPGATVQWSLIGVEQHDVTGRANDIASGPMDPGDMFSFRFDQPGRYDYVCTFHIGNGMFGSVTVVP